MGRITQRSFVFFIFLSVLTRGFQAQNLLDPIPRLCKSLVVSASSEEEVDVQRNEYPAGGTLLALASVPEGVKGVFEFYLCTEDGKTDDEECLVKIPLQLVNIEGSKFDLSTVTKAGTYEIPIRVPEDITCAQCTLQWRVLIEECADETNCQIMDEEFCSDISIREIKGEEDKRFFGFLWSFVKSTIG